MRRAFTAFNKWWLAYEYKHTTLAVLAIIVFVFLIDSALIVGVVHALDEIGYASGLIAGALSVSFFTAVPALVLIFDLAQQFDPLILALLVAIGSVVGDWLILKFYEERIFTELAPLIDKLKIRKLKASLERRSTRWILVVTGAFIISSPLPDEVGLALMGISRSNRWAVLAICFVLNLIGAWFIILAMQALA